MKKKSLERKVILALCLSMAFREASAYAADVVLSDITNNAVDRIKNAGYTVNGSNQTIDITNGSITTSLDNSSWSPTDNNGAADAYGIFNWYKKGVTLQGEAGRDFPIRVSGQGSMTNPKYAYGQARGITEYGSVTTINSNLAIETTAVAGIGFSAHGAAEGIFENDHSNLTINGDVAIKTFGTGGNSSTGNGITIFQNSACIINGSTEIQARARCDENAAFARGISGVGTVTINGNTEIQAIATGSGNTASYAFGIEGNDLIAEINGNTKISTQAIDRNGYAYALYGVNNSRIAINNAAGHPHTVQLSGDVVALNNAVIHLTLANQTSFLRGNLLNGNSGTNTINFTVANGAVWQPVYDNRNGTFNPYNASIIAGSYSTSENTVKTLNLSSGGTADLTWDNTARTTARTLNIGTVSGIGGKVKINTDIANHTGDQIVIHTVNQPTTLQVDIGYDGAMARGTTYSGAVTNYSPVTVLNGANYLTLIGTAKEERAYRLSPTFSGTNLTNIEVGASSNTKAAASAVSGQSLLMQSSDNHLKKRLGDLRNTPEAKEGIWARVYSGEVSNDKYNRVEMDYKGMQVGYDKSKPSSGGRRYTGGALSYTTADNNFYRGGGENKNGDIALYQAWVEDDGHYYDVIAKFGQLNSKYHVTDLSDIYSTADYKTWTNSLSAEYGYRKQMRNGWYLEPQVELTFGRINGVDYTTSTGMNVKQDSVDRLIGRIGIGTGRTLSNGNQFFTSLSMLHEFKGDENIKADTLRYHQDQSGTWYEFILGANAKLSNHSNAYINMEKLFGEYVSSNWQLNAGCRWSF